MKNTHEAFLETTKINGKIINVYGVWDSPEDFEANEDPEFYDVYFYEEDDFMGTHLNEGNPLFEMPTVADCEQLLKEYFEN